MDKKKAVYLIKLEVLGCINKEDSDTLRLSKENDENFPFKELGEYQNLIALLPSTLMLEFPSNELKDKVAMKLYSIREEIKAKVEARKAAEEPLELVEEEKVNLEEVEEIEEEIPVKPKDSTIKEAELLHTKMLEKTGPERPVEEIAAKRQPNEIITIIVPQFVPKRWYHNLLHTQTALWLRLALLFQPGIVITDVPYQIDQ